MTTVVQAAIEVEGIDHVVLRVADIERAIGFYCGVLGLSVDRRRPELGLVHLRAGRAMVDLVDATTAAARNGGQAPDGEHLNMDHFAINVRHFDEAAIAAQLARHGVAPGKKIRRYGAFGEGWSMYVKDPDGNTVELKGPPEPA